MTGETALALDYPEIYSEHQLVLFIWETPWSLKDINPFFEMCMEPGCGQGMVPGTAQFLPDLDLLGGHWGCGVSRRVLQCCLTSGVDTK